MHGLKDVLRFPSDHHGIAKRRSTSEPNTETEPDDDRR
jgi:hypothetical protein